MAKKDKTIVFSVKDILGQLKTLPEHNTVLKRKNPLKGFNAKWRLQRGRAHERWLNNTRIIK